MGTIKLLLNVLIILSCIAVMYMIIDLSIKKIYLKKGKIEKIYNKKYIIIIIILMLLFIVYGILRNFV